MLVDFGILDLAPEKILAFRPSEASQQHSEDLMKKLHDGSINDAEQAELNYYLEFDHMLRLMKARAAEVLGTRAA